jgi:membrane fusion protein (multidrug efflux system)
VSRLLPLFLCLLCTACAKEAPPQRTVEVVVDRAVSESYRPVSKYVGRLQARDDVAIQAQVTGYLLSRDFDEGKLVEAGDLLFTIDSSEYKAAMARARADLAAALAAQANAERNYKRGRELLPKGAISQSELDNLTARKLDADARVESAHAQIASAQVNLNHTVITAPISGRIGRSSVSVGDLVGPNTGTLTTLVSIDPIEALFQISEATLIDAILARPNRAPDELPSDIEVTLELANGMVYPEVGEIDFIGNRIDATTGTLEARARIPNPHSLLVPGQYVRVMLKRATPVEGLFIPQAAVQADQQGSFVLIVDDSDTVARRNVELGHRKDVQVLVRQGLEAGDRVIVRGLQQVRPGMTVVTRSLAELAG